MAYNKKVLKKVMKALLSIQDSKAFFDSKVPIVMGFF